MDLPGKAKEEGIGSQKWSSLYVKQTNDRLSNCVAGNCQGEFKNLDVPLAKQMLEIHWV